MILPPQVHTAFALLEQAGFEAWLVGGAVRDYVRDGSPAHDWDITTNALPQQMQEIFRDFTLIETGLKHGTVTVVMDGLPLEITTYRVDGSYSDHRHPDEVRFTRSLREDLERRDFTMNALAYHPQQGVIDLVGGVADIRAGLVRCVGDPNRRFREDSLRILRALRFASVLGLEIEPATAAAIRTHCGLLKAVAAERIREELTRLLCGVDAARILTDFADVLAVPLPVIRPMFGFDQHNPHHDRDIWAHTVAVVAAAPAEPVLRWAALLHDAGKPDCFTLGEDGVGHFYGHAPRSTELAGNVLSALRFDNAGRDAILRLIRYHDMPLLPDRKAVRRLLNKHGEEGARRLIELHRADTIGQAPRCRERLALFREVEAMVDNILAEQDCFSLKDLAINGRDMMELGLQGPDIGRTLQQCLSDVMEDRLPNEREVLLSCVQKNPKKR